ncbi:hypothetical protein BCR32DRAFT_291021 [Anaeromyces robustus]|uniref:RRM domain-containing protein n=1 Tax=Anaeromyces robustus TaxID=1754192 RepID=A0A1Y1XGS9_9FUNG|nr:hypothetical protein BCR32DRAFT_291021 [Anaeromyces robustus]|eukprot:ORX84959.1 hypothetical protein BCR32DRAFT_291021 [Anaeromyces robustus]
MTSLLDMSLDEQILKSKRENKGSFRRNNRKSNHSRDINDQWKHDKYEDNNRDRRQILSRIGGRHGQNNDKSAILITNLHWEVSENDLKSLFEKVGEVNKVRIKYDKAGRSDGEATVIFNSSSAARKAIDKYDGVELDGMEMSIKMDDSYSKRNNNDSKRSGRGSILSRLGQGKGFKNKQFNRSNNNKSNRNSRRRVHKETVTKEMLDEEMDRYMSNEMDVEENNDGSTSARNLVSYVDEDEPVKGEINNA